MTGCPPAVALGPGARLLQNVEKYDESRLPMIEAEMVHFHSADVNIADLFARLEPVVKAYARSGTRKPKDVGRRLTAESYRTAAGARWDPRLTRFLLALMFNGPEKGPQQPDGSRGASKPAPLPRKAYPARTTPILNEPLTVDSMADALPSWTCHRKRQVVGDALIAGR
uniref:Uncharacterized protein n=1 Tax=Rhodopseudomonas palustris (strain BisA53) TaxID=316055 RepID=Q07NQ6_RHOP5